MSKIISNTSPLIALSMINQLQLLWFLFDDVFIPTSVYNEVCAPIDESAPAKKQVVQAVPEKKIILYKVEDYLLVERMYGKMHKGELETIVGGRELNIDFVLIDERVARDAAKALLINPIGTLGILRIAKHEGVIDRIKPHLNQLISQGFRLSKEVYHTLLTLENEM